MRSATTICGVCDQVRSRQRRNNCKVYNNGRAKLTPIRRCPSGRPSCAPSALLRCPQPRRHPSPSTGTRASEAKRAQARKKELAAAAYQQPTPAIHASAKRKSGSGARTTDANNRRARKAPPTLAPNSEGSNNVALFPSLRSSFSSPPCTRP
jgi:hypothetical protein